MERPHRPQRIASSCPCPSGRRDCTRRCLRAWRWESLRSPSSGFSSSQRSRSAAPRCSTARPTPTSSSICPGASPTRIMPHGSCSAHRGSQDLQGLAARGGAHRVVGPRATRGRRCRDAGRSGRDARDGRLAAGSTRACGRCVTPAAAWWARATVLRDVTDVERTRTRLEEATSSVASWVQEMNAVEAVRLPFAQAAVTAATMV